MAEGMRLDFRIDAFNVSNHTSWIEHKLECVRVLYIGNATNNPAWRLVQFLTAGI
jgi:hypothetical protein